MSSRNMPKHAARLALGALLLAMPVVAQAQARSCAMPARIPAPRIETARPDQVRRTPITRYLLALSWSPQHCRDADNRRDGDLQCGGAHGRFGFVLHGLWPESTGSDWPQYCAPAPRLSTTVIRRNLCMTPSVQLLQHEWARHGICMTRNPDRYFAAARRAYAAVRYPDMAALARQDDLTVGGFTRAFAAANPGMDADMIAVQTRGRRWLDEVRICLDRRLRPQACPPASRGAPAGQPLGIEPPQD